MHSNPPLPVKDKENAADLLIPPRIGEASIFSRLLSGGFRSIVARVGTSITTLVLYALLARRLEPSELGKYFVIFGLVGLLGGVASLGLQVTIVRFIASNCALGKPHLAKRALLGTVQVAMVSTAAAGGLILISLEGARSLHYWTGSFWLSGLMAAWAMLWAWQSIIGGAYRGFHHIGRASIHGGIAASALAIVMFYTYGRLSPDATLGVAVSLSVLAIFLGVAVGAISLRRQYKDLEESDVRSNDTQDISKRTILATVVPVLLANLVIAGQSQMDVWVLTIAHTSSIVALYASAARLAVMISTPLLVSVVVTAPLIAEMYSRGEKRELESMLRSVAALATIPSVIGCLAVVVFGHGMLNTVFGHYYGAAYSMLVILALANVANVITGSCAELLLMTGHQRVHLWLTVAVGVLTLVAIIVVQSYGPVAVASAIAMGMVVRNLALVMVAYRMTGVLSLATVNLAQIRLATKL